MRTLVLVVLSLITFSCSNDQSKPNILWIVTEDNSVHYMNLYTEGGAEMPTISSIASEGVVFDNAFSNAPVCSVARSTLITGVYAPRIGTQYHRKMSKVKLPDDVKPLPVYLKEAGYYTTNNAKEDYNLLKMERYGMNHLERQRIKTGKKVNLSSMFKIFTTLMKVNYILIRNILKVH